MHGSSDVYYHTLFKQRRRRAWRCGSEIIVVSTKGKKLSYKAFTYLQFFDKKITVKIKVTRLEAGERRRAL